MRKAWRSGGGLARWALVLLTLCVLSAAGVGTAAASGNGKPESPPGQGECEHGNSGKPCRDDPQPEHGKECDAHGNQGGVNEDHCGGVTAPEPPPPTTAVTTTTTATTTTTQTKTSTPSNPPPPPTTTKTSPPAPPEHEPEQEAPKEERAPSSTPPKATTSKTADAPKAKQETAEPKQGVKAASAPGATTNEAGSAPPRVLAVTPKTAEGRLPFTGLPLWVFVLSGLTALVAGLAVRRLARAGRQTAE